MADRPGWLGGTYGFTDDVAERNPRREDVGDGPHRHPVPPQIPQRDGHRGDEPAVEHPAGAEQIEELARARLVLVEFDDEEQQLRARERADDDPDAEVHHPVRIEAARDGIVAMMEGRFPGKIVIFPQISGLPLTSIADMKATYPDLAAKLDPGEFAGVE